MTAVIKAMLGVAFVLVVVLIIMAVVVTPRPIRRSILMARQFWLARLCAPIRSVHGQNFTKDSRERKQ
jgi:hypothetical protein